MDWLKRFVKGLLGAFGALFCPDTKETRHAGVYAAQIHISPKTTETIQDAYRAWVVFCFAINKEPGSIEQFTELLVLHGMERLKSLVREKMEAANNV